MTDGLEHFVGGVADGRNLPVGNLARDEHEVVEVQLTADGEVWHVGHPAPAAPSDPEGLQTSQYRFVEERGEYMVLD